MLFEAAALKFYHFCVTFPTIAAIMASFIASLHGSI